LRGSRSGVASLLLHSVRALEFFLWSIVLCRFWRILVHRRTRWIEFSGLEHKLQVGRDSLLQRALQSLSLD
jgi:hypothetical protein